MGKKSRHGKEYRRLLRPLKADLVALQEWVKASGGGSAGSRTG
nr:hypothetical protein [Nocardia cerradoensis]